tara:strand:- start:196 stop:342 length:147 start_codon:yes stop_codon:yes gene_type:complete
MDETVMKWGGAAKRAELIKMFSDLNISKAASRDLTSNETNIAKFGDKG